MTTYKTLKDLPGCPAGTIFVCRNKDDIYQTEDGYNGVEFDGYFIKAHPDWFAEVKQQTLMEVVENLIRVKESWNTSFISDKFLSAYNNLRDAYNREIAEREKK